MGRIEAAENIDWLQEQLRQAGLLPADSSAFGRVLGAGSRVQRFANYFPPRREFARYRDDVFYMASLNELAKAIDLAGTDFLEALANRRRVFAGEDAAILGETPQNQARDLMWEVYMGALLAQAYGPVAFAEPEDIRFSVRGESWGAPCKVLYTAKRERHVDAVITGVKQLEASQADYGVVLVNGSRLVNHDDFFPRSPDRLADVDVANMHWQFGTRRLSAAALQLRESLFGAQLQRRATEDKNGMPRPKVQLVLLFTQTVTLAGGDFLLLSSFDFLEFPGESAERVQVRDALFNAKERVRQHRIR